MKKRFIIAIIAVLIVAACSLVACGDNSSVTPLTPIADIPDAATVEVGGLFDFETAAVAKGEKVYSPASVTVTFGEDENVEFTGTSFTPKRVGKYTITFTFDIDGETKTYATEITAVDTTKPSILLSSDIPVRAELNADVALPVFTAVDICDGELSADVKVYKNNAEKTPITVTEGKFKIDTYDGAVIEASATDNAGNTATDTYTVAVRGEREVDYFENEPYAMGNAVGFGGGKTEWNTASDYCIQGEGSLKFYTDISGKWVFCGFPSINEAVRIAGGKDDFKTEYSAITLLLYNASPYDCEIEMQYWKKNPQNGLAQYEKLVQKNQLIANCWTKISVPADKIADAYDAYKDDMFFGLFFNGANHEANNAYANFCVYVDCIRLSKSDDATSIEIKLSDIKQKSKGDTTDVELIKLSALNGVDLNKLSVTALDKDGKSVTVEKTASAYVLKNVEEGKYTVQYMYANGENIDVFSQTVELYAPLADPYFDGFEGGGYTHTGKLLIGSATIDVSDEKARSGTHSLKITTGEWSRYTAIPLMLDDDMWQKIKDAGNNVELSVWLYIKNNNTNITKFNVRFCGLKNENGNYANGDWAMIYNDTFGNNAPTGQWLQIKYGINYNKPAIEQLKQTGSIAMQVGIAEIADTSQTVGFTYYVDDLEVTVPDTNVTISAANKSVPLAGGGTSVEIASFTGSNFNADCLTVTLNGQPYTDYTLLNGKLSFTPTGEGEYTFVYTHKNGHFVNTATQTVTVFDPTFDGFEKSNHATVVIAGNNTSYYDINGVDGNYYSGSKGLWCYVDYQYISIRIMFNQDMINAIQDNSSVSLRIKIKDKTSNTGVNLRVHAYNGNNTSWESGLGIGCDGNGQWWEHGNTPIGEWLEIKFTGAEAVKQIKTNGGIMIYNDIDRFGGHPVQICVDDIKVTNN